MIKTKRLISITFLSIGFFPLISQAQIAPNAIVGMSISDLRQALDAGKIRSVDIVSAFTAEIEKNNAHGKKLNAVISLNPDALTQARAWDQQFAEHPGTSKNILSGIPFLAKDNFDT